jgi:uncharacterized protein YjbI with pentapeptide repeats
MVGCAFTFDPGDTAVVDDIDGEWHCPHEAYGGADHCVFHLPDGGDGDATAAVDPMERRRALEAVLDSDTRASKRLLGARLDHLDMAYLVLSGRNRYALDLRCADIGELSLAHAESEIPLDLRGADIGHLDLDNAEFEEDVHVTNAELGSVDGFETVFERDADFSGTRFEGAVNFDQAEFEDEAHFEDARFAGATQFRGASFHGGSNVLDDNTAFTGATFESDVSFEQSRFEVATFAEATFTAEADFEQTRFDGDVLFRSCAFDGFADFDETRFEGDATFEAARFTGRVDFRGASFRGGDRVLEADASFVDVSFDGTADFRLATFRGADFSGATFADDAMFEESRYRADVSFSSVAFGHAADFDEARFDGDADFSETTFDAPAVFRGAEFRGEANHLEDNATFAEAAFRSTVDFDSATFTTVTFRHTRFGGTVDLAEATITDRAEFEPRATADDVVVDLTGGAFPSGLVRQPAAVDEWVAYDLTRATLGDVTLEAADAVPGRTLLASVRFCETEFDGFDFSAHRAILERADWILHEFDAPAGYDPAHDLDPRAVELTYLKAANAAKAQGDRDAGVEFSIKKASYRREKNVGLLTNPRLPVGRRLVKAGEVVGNYAWYASCGYGYRLWRILAASVVVVITWGFIYALLPLVNPDSGTTDKIDGLSSLTQLSAAEGWAILVDNVYFSLVTFTTVGYGDVNPVGWAKGFAAVEGALGVLLASLVVFVLGRRVAI